METEGIVRCVPNGAHRGGGARGSAGGAAPAVAATKRSRDAIA